VRSTLGPKAMLKLLIDPMGGILITNDGNAIIREVDVAHPAAKSMQELARSQDEEVGDGTTSVIVLGEWHRALPLCCAALLFRSVAGRGKGRVAGVSFTLTVPV